MRWADRKRMRGARSKAHTQARVVNAVVDYVQGKQDMRHVWPSLEAVAWRHGFASGFTLSQASSRVLGASPRALWVECQETGTTDPIFHALNQQQPTQER